jgi:hypothetical protein
LVHGIAVTHCYRAVFKRLGIHREAVGRSGLVLTAVPATHGPAVIIENTHVRTNCTL